MSVTCCGYSCGVTCDGRKLTNQRFRRNKVLVDYFYLNPATGVLPVKGTAAYTALLPYARTNGMLVGQDPLTGYLKMAWEYADVSVFAAEFVGALDYAEPVEADCNTPPRKGCGGDGKVAVVTLGGGVAYELASATEVWTHMSVIPTLFDPGTGNIVHPFVVDVAAGASDDAIGYVKLGKPGVNACAVEVNVRSALQCLCKLPPAE